MQGGALCAIGLAIMDDVSPHDLVVKRSVDRGRSWGALQTVVDCGEVWPGEGGEHGGASAFHACAALDSGAQPGGGGQGSAICL